MGRQNVVTISLSEIASTVFSNKLRPLYIESLGGVQFLNLDLKAILNRSFNPNSVVVLNLPIWSTEHENSIRQLRVRGFQGQILVIVKDIKLWNVDVLDPRDYHHVTFIEKPYSNTELVGLIRRLLGTYTSHFRASPRYDLSQEAKVDIGNNSGPQLCVVKNVSLGGACIEFKDEVPVTPGSIVTLNVNLGRDNEAHTVRGRVAWVQKYKSQFGIEFMGLIAI